MELGCVEFAVPGDTLGEKLRTLETHGMWLELTNDGKKRTDDILEEKQNFDVPIKSIQAYLQHEMSILSADKGERESAISHIEETIELARAVEAQNVVVIITYDRPEVESPWEKSVELFKRLGRLGEELDVTISVEPLGQEKTTFLPDSIKVLKLVREVSLERVQLMIDTMHIHSSNQDPEEIISELAPKISEIQLRDTNSKPPGRGNLDFPSILEVVREKFRGLLCLEYHPSSHPQADFSDARETVEKVIPGV